MVRPITGFEKDAVVAAGIVRAAAFARVTVTGKTTTTKAKTVG